MPTKKIILIFNRSPARSFFHWMFNEQEIILVWPNLHIFYPSWNEHTICVNRNQNITHTNEIGCFYNKS